MQLSHLHGSFCISLVEYTLVFNLRNPTDITIIYLKYKHFNLYTNNVESYQLAGYVPNLNAPVDPIDRAGLQTERELWPEVSIRSCRTGMRYGAGQDTLPHLWWDINHGDTVGTEKCIFRVVRPGSAARAGWERLFRPHPYTLMSPWAAGEGSNNSLTVLRSFGRFAPHSSECHTGGMTQWWRDGISG